MSQSRFRRSAAAPGPVRDHDDVPLREYTERLAEELAARIVALDALTDAKFVTYRTLIDSQAEKVALALAAADRAIQKAEAATEKRFDNVNEFRKTLSDQAQDFVTRREYEVSRQSTVDRLGEVQGRLDKAEGRSTGLQSGYGYLIAGIGALVVLVNLGIYLLGQ